MYVLMMESFPYLLRCLMSLNLHCCWFSLCRKRLEFYTSTYQTCCDCHCFSLASLFASNLFMIFKQLQPLSSPFKTTFTKKIFTELTKLFRILVDEVLYFSIFQTFMWLSVLKEVEDQIGTGIMYKLRCLVIVVN